MKEFLSVKEIHERTGISTDAIHRAIRRGELKASKVANRVIVHVDDFRAWIRDHQVATDRAPEARPLPRKPARPARAGSLAALRSIERGGAA